MSEQNIGMPGLGGKGLPISGGTEAPRVDAAILGGRWASSASRVWEILKLIFSFPAMLGTFLVGATFYDGRTFAVDPDVWWHMKAGQTILATRHWPTVDAYSFTVHGQPWMAYEWLGDVLIGAVARIGGLRGLDALLIALGSAVMIALYVFGTIRSGNSKAGFVAAAVLVSLATPSFTMRPQMLGYLFLVLTLIVLELFRQGKQWPIWFLPALVLVWVNTHGSFIIGLGVILVYLVCGLKEFRMGGIEAKKWMPKERVRLEFVFLLCLAALPITPYGTRLAVYPFDMAVAQPINVANVLEWHSMPFDLAVGKIFLALVFGFFAAQMALSLKWRLEELTLFLGGVAMACVHLRFMLLFVPFFTPLLATVVARWLPCYDARKDKYILNVVLMAGVIAAMVHYFPSRASLDKTVAEKFPTKAVDYLREHPVPGPMFNSYGFGGYLVWNGQKVFIDGRGDLYERGGVFSDYLQVAQVKPTAAAILRNYGIQSCLIERGAILASLLGASPEWRELYSDSTSEIFVRQKTGEAAVQQR
ncbi:MAG TPA: hypothetical protein VGR97_10750 [Candidatus Acidoferrales bacterium]|nr:hypothetical protein [Candidatus Acidoferrales bacterium]